MNKLPELEKACILLMGKEGELTTEAKTPEDMK